MDISEELKKLSDEELLELYKLVEEHLEYLNTSIIITEEDGDDNNE